MQTLFVPNLPFSGASRVVLTLLLWIKLTLHSL